LFAIIQASKSRGSVFENDANWNYTVRMSIETLIGVVEIEVPKLSATQRDKVLGELDVSVIAQSVFSVDIGSVSTLQLLAAVAKWSPQSVAGATNEMLRTIVQVGCQCTPRGDDSKQRLNQLIFFLSLCSARAKITKALCSTQSRKLWKLFFPCCKSLV
jgi:hypothetical protein